MLPRSLPHEENIAGGKIQNSREVGQVAGPVSPGSYESGKVSERAFAPDVEAALVRVPRRKLQYRQRQRRIETEPRPDPNHDGTRPGRRRRGDPPQADPSDHVKQNEVAKPHHLARTIWLLGVGDRNACGKNTHAFGLVGAWIRSRQWRVSRSG